MMYDNFAAQQIAAGNSDIRHREQATEWRAVNLFRRLSGFRYRGVRHPPRAPEFGTLDHVKIINWRNTIEHGAILLSATVAIHVFCKVAYTQFRAEQPDGVGKWASAIFGNYSWVGIAIAIVLTGMLVVSQVRKLQSVYEMTYNVSLCLLWVWLGVASIVMGIPFISSFDLRGPSLW